MSNEARHQDQTTATTNTAAVDESQAAFPRQPAHAHPCVRTHEDETWLMTLRPLMSLTSSMASPGNSGRR